MLNKTILQGRLVAAPELKQTTNGIAVATFTVAWSDRRGDYETSCFLRCTAWRQTAEFLSKYFNKGQEIIVCGKLEQKDWTDKEGNKRSNIELTVEEAHFCGSKGADSSTAAEKIDDTDEILPF